MNSTFSRLTRYHRLLDALEAELAWVRALPCAKEPEPPERIARCQARKQEMLWNAREKGLIP